MMLALVYLGSVIWLGLIINCRARFSGNAWAAAAFSYITGTQLTTFFIFVLSLLLGFHERVVILAIISTLAAGCLLFRRDGAGLEWCITSWQAPMSMWAALLIVTPFALLGVWTADCGSVFFTGNRFDDCFHMGMVKSFVVHHSVLIDNPQSAGFPLRYHFLANLNVAVYHILGMSMMDAYLFTQALLAFSMAILTSHFLEHLTRSGSKALLGLVLFFGLDIGFINVVTALCGFPLDGKTLTWADLSTQKCLDIILFPYGNWLDPLTNLLVPQRPYLLGFSLVMIVLHLLVNRCESASEAKRKSDLWLAAWIVALMPLFHLHSALFLALVISLLLIWRARQSGRSFTLLVPLMIMVLQVGYLSTSGSPSAEFSGFDVFEQGIIRESELTGFMPLDRSLFWLRVAGWSFLLGIPGMIYGARRFRLALPFDPGRYPFQAVALASVILFIVINIYRFTPSFGDNNKFFLFFHLVMCVAGACLLSDIVGRHGLLLRAAIGALLSIAVLLPLVVGNVIMSYRNYFFHISDLFTGGDKGSVHTLLRASDLAVAHWIFSNTSKEAVILAEDGDRQFIPALTGRRVVDGVYTIENGYSSVSRKSEVFGLYSEPDMSLFSKYGIDYVLVSDREMVYKPNIDKLNRMLSLVYDQHSGDVDYLLYRVEK